MHIASRCYLAAVAAAILLAPVPSLRAEALRSPWDIHPVAPHAAAYTCTAPAALPHDIVAADFYSDSKHSIIDPKRYAAYNEAQKQFGDVTKAAETAADTFQQTGNSAAAACVLQILQAQAAANAMTGNMSTNQANYVQNWTMGALAITYLKVRSASPAATPAQTAAMQAWMKLVGQQIKDYFQARRDKQTVDGRNNHFYWAGFAVMSVGIAVNDRALYDWGVTTYKAGVDLIQPDGTLPLEMARGQRALHYHLFAIAPLVTMAELGKANGDDLYAYNHNALHLLISRAMAGLVDNHYFADKAGVAQDTPEGGKIKSNDVGPITPFLRRFPDPAFAALVNQVTITPYGYLGGLPPK